MPQSTQNHAKTRSQRGSDTCIPRLSCELCRERKVRCDKAIPHCTNCVKAGKACVPVYRKRHSRGRHTPRRHPGTQAEQIAPAARTVLQQSEEDGLQDRVRRLECLINDMNRERQDADDVFRDASASQTPQSSLLFGLDPTPSPHVCGNINTYKSIESRLERHVKQHFWRDLVEEVDPIVKILHRPTLDAYLVDCKGFLDYDPCDPSPAALRAAVCYAAVASMTEEQSKAVFSCPKLKVLPEFRNTCDVALNRAVRIAKALSLHLEQPITSGSFFQRQMKYRLWCTICVLDLQASLDWATEPQIDLEAEHYTLPRNINDADFDMSFQGADMPDRDELTDITFSLVTYKAQLSGRLLDFKGTTTSSTTSSSSSPGHAAATVWEGRLGEARRFEDQTRRLLAACDPESSAYAWFTFHETNSIISSMRLSALRPLHHRAGLLRAPPPPRAQGANDRALAAALSVLSKSQLVRSDPRGEGFRWSVRTQWHALSVAVAECLVCPDEQLLASAWPVVEAAYESACAVKQQQQQQHGVEAAAADHCRQGGAPGQPLQVLMLKTRARVKRLLRGAPVRGGAVKTPAAVGGERSSSEWSSSTPKTPAGPLTLLSPSLMGLAGTKEAAADPLALTTSLDFGFGPTPVLTPSNGSPDRGTGASASLGQGLGEVWSLMPTYSSSMTDTSMGDEVDLEAGPGLSWQAWEDILSGVTPKEGFFDSSIELC
ncbi:hypothetical protein SLS64_011549 [Diaporthe eres]